jgi:hypothetical protein
MLMMLVTKILTLDKGKYFILKGYIAFDFKNIIEKELMLYVFWTSCFKFFQKGVEMENQTNDNADVFVTIKKKRIGTSIGF